MNISEKISECILKAESKALATYSNGEINVVPVSTIKIVEEKIVLVNYFMNKTLQNIKENPNVSLVCWKGLEGCQIKGKTEYFENGELFDSIKAWVTEILPTRIVKGVLVLTPNEIYDVSADIERAGKKLN